MKLRLKTILFCLLALVCFQGCGPKLSSQALELLSGSQEVSECNQTFSYSDTVNLIGKADFFKRSTNLVISNSEVKNIVLGDPTEDSLPIPFAEVAVYDDKLQLSQCGITDLDGNILGLNFQPLKLPKAVKSFTLRVYARSFYLLPNLQIKTNISVKEDIFTNKIYFLEKKFTTNGVNDPVVNVTALVRQTEDLSIKGGAFNIYNNVIQSYLFLDGHLNLSSNQVTCLANEANIYWKAGFNPFQYINPTADPATLTNTSYYLASTNSLYISGGQVGDVSLSNTDHFDDFAIIHELGHFIEAQCGRSPTPGQHDLIVRIDPRISWHEAWANYFAAIILNQNLSRINPELNNQLESGLAGTGNTGFSYLYNTYGFTDSVQNITNGSGFLVDLKRPTNSPGVWPLGTYINIPFDPTNPTLFPGEGHFREVATSRALFKMSVLQNTLCSTCSTSSIFTSSTLAFDTIWRAIDANTGIGQSEFQFISSHTVLELIKTTLGNLSWANLYKPVAEAESLHLLSDNNISSTDKKFVTDINGTEHLNWIPYGHRLVVSSNCTQPTSIQPRTDDPFLTGQNSDQRYSNHFYTIDPATLVGLDSIDITFSRANGTNTDIDVILYKPNYGFNQDYDCTGGFTSSGSCPSNNFFAIRTTNETVLASNRNPASTLSTQFTKSLTNLSQIINSNQKYLLNIRAYTANRSLSLSTLYQYQITTNLGDLCPE